MQDPSHCLSSFASAFQCLQQQTKKLMLMGIAIVGSICGNICTVVSQHIEIVATIQR